MNKIGVTKVGVTKVVVTKVCVTKVCVTKVGVTKVGVTKVGVTKVGVTNQYNCIDTPPRYQIGTSRHTLLRQVSEIPHREGITEYTCKYQPIRWHRYIRQRNYDKGCVIILSNNAQLYYL